MASDPLDPSGRSVDAQPVDSRAIDAQPVDSKPVDSRTTDPHASDSRSFAIGDHDFLLDGEPFRILSGALHYFRVHPDLWADRIRKARQMGLNTIETYIAWNEHAPARGRFDLEGGLDLGRFLDLVAAEGMLAIVRPGPFICAEWDNGGLPAWLFTDPDVGVRRSEPRYLAAVAEYFDQVLPTVASRQIDVGGPVILVQIENEYGAFGADKEYLEALVTMTRAGGITVPLTSIDQPTDQMLADGSLPYLHKTASFGSRAIERLETLRSHQPTGPLMCAEFWDGWFDHWGAHHHTTPASDAAAELDDLLATGASVNFYMFHGGSNFAFTNGANDKGTYNAIVTSYDYDAPLDELGDPGPKYWAFRDVIARYAPVSDDTPRVARPRAESTVQLDRVLPLADLLSDATWAGFDHLPTMDELGHYRGFAVYRTTLDRGGVLVFGEVRDRALVFLDGRAVGVLSRDAHERAIVLPSGGELEIVLEDQGRVNYGHRIGEPKGLIGPVALDGHPVSGWMAHALSLDAPPVVSSTGASPAGPAFFAGSFEADGGADLVLDAACWGKGVAFVNGVNLGRYWSRGPQRSLVVPGPIVRAGVNELVVFELHAMTDRIARFVSGLDLGHTEY